MAQEPRTVQPVEFFEPGRTPAFGKDFSIYRAPADVEVTPAEVEEDPKDSSVTESAPSLDSQPSGPEVEPASAEKVLPQTTTDPSTQTSSTTPETLSGSGTQPADLALDTIQTSGSPDSEKLLEEMTPKSSASDVPSEPSVTTSAPVPTPTRASGQASSTTNPRKGNK
jgi:hypothetical protein